jgi:serine/threonine-protein kinase
VPERLALRTIERGVDAETGAPFMVTSLSAHPSLAQLIEVCPLQANEMVTLTRNLCVALDAAHAAGVLHLAIKPTNIFVGPLPELSVQLADFGANMLRFGGPAEARLAFSAPWLAPEQVADDEHSDRSADIFAVALVAFTSVTGKSFWRCWNRPEGNVESWLEEVLGDRASVSARAAETGVSLPRALDEVFARALNPDRRARFASAGAFSKALDEATGASAVATSRPAFPAPSSTEVSSSNTATNVEPPLPLGPATKRLPPWTRKVTATAVIVLLAAVGATVWFTRGSSKSKGQASLNSSVAPGPSIAVPPAPTAVASIGPGPSIAVPPAIVPTAPPAVATIEPPSVEDQAELNVVCVPSCEAVAIDGTMYSEYPAPARLSSGTHAVGVSRPHFYGDWRRVTLRPGEKRTVTFHLIPVLAMPPAPAQKKPLH